MRPERKDCSECGRNFQPMNCRIVTCSPTCSERRKYKRKLAAQAAKAAAKPKKKPCVACGKEFKLKNNTMLYCSAKCKYRSQMLRQARQNAKQRVKDALEGRPDIHRVQVKTVRPRALKSHSPELQQHINRFLQNGGTVQRIPLQDESRFQHLPRLEEEVEEQWVEGLAIRNLRELGRF